MSTNNKLAIYGGKPVRKNYLPMASSGLMMEIFKGLSMF
ncbi:hypothetical protein N752_20010 [Desulforamulus aquiferis]|nr:hypothetical protein N752_20010 [Desulforamulus aquiferis]